MHRSCAKIHHHHFPITPKKPVFIIFSLLCLIFQNNLPPISNLAKPSSGSRLNYAQVSLTTCNDIVAHHHNLLEALRTIQYSTILSRHGRDFSTVTWKKGEGKKKINTFGEPKSTKQTGHGKSRNTKTKQKKRTVWKLAWNEGSSRRQSNRFSS